MAVDKIDKSLPNVKEKVYVESPEEIEIDQSEKIEEINKDGVEIVQNEDGSAEIEFEPGYQEGKAVPVRFVLPIKFKL